MTDRRSEMGRRLAAFSVLGSAALAAANIAAGLMSGSTAVTAAGFEFAGDVLASLVVFLGILIASRPADENHPYGHGRFEILAGLLVGMFLMLAGTGICIHALNGLGDSRPVPSLAAAWAPVMSMLVKSGFAVSKFRLGRQIGSAALIADAWNDSVDILSALTALTALWLTAYNPVQFVLADRYGGFAVGLIVIATGLRVVRDASLELTDTMPPAGLLVQIRTAALQVPDVMGVEKCFARKTGFQYHVDLHVEVNPKITVAEGHLIAHRVQDHVRGNVPFVAGVLVHVEPLPDR